MIICMKTRINVFLIKKMAAAYAVFLLWLAAYDMYDALPGQNIHTLTLLLYQGSCHIFQSGQSASSGQCCSVMMLWAWQQYF